MIKTLKRGFRYIRNKKKSLTLRYYSLRYDKAPVSNSSLKNVKSVALLRWDDKLGDAIMSGVFIKALCTYRPDISITVITPDFSARWYEKLNLCEVIRCDKRSKRTAFTFKQYRDRFDAVLDLGTSFSHKELIALSMLNAQHNIGFNKQGHPIFNHCLPPSAQHFKQRYLDAAKLFIDRIENISIPLIPFDTNATLAPSLASDYVAVNLYGSSKYRQFSETDAVTFLKKWLDSFPTDHIVLIPVPGKSEVLERIVSTIASPNVVLPHNTPSLEFTLQLLSSCTLCFTPDTSVVHMASALNVPTLAVYADDPKNLDEWKPLSAENEVILNPKAKSLNDRVYVHQFEWDEFVSKRLALKNKLV
ncbi:glycosyltransferase family 9 protein [Vibrio scophthalmi]|uniref:glycosyltransferase family 9 protein n=1 Tax=Vibrio scophthalmi TaxID=45658 RepID=UPI002FF2FAB3